MEKKNRLLWRGNLMRSMGQFREMLPGSFVRSMRKCGKPRCRCVDGKHLHAQYLLSVLADGKLRTINIPARIAERVEAQVRQHKNFREVEAEICRLNLEILLEEKNRKE
jgi:hypothetical protein